MKVAIIDYKCGNIASLKNAIEFLGFDAEVTNTTSTIKACDKLVLPGVGTFKQGMQNLQKNHLIDFLQEAVFGDKKPILGICLGAQLMLDGSEESPDHKGLSWIEGSVNKIIPTGNTCRVPHVGWDSALYTQDSLFAPKDSKELYYYTHSFCLNMTNPVDIIAHCDYASGFSAVFMKDNIIGCQFHPEKSQKAGLQFLKRYLDL